MQCVSKQICENGHVSSDFFSRKWRRLTQHRQATSDWNIIFKLHRLVISNCFSAFTTSRCMGLPWRMVCFSSQSACETTAMLSLLSSRRGSCKRHLRARRALNSFIEAATEASDKGSRDTRPSRHRQLRKTKEWEGRKGFWTLPQEFLRTLPAPHRFASGRRCCEAQRAVVRKYVGS